MIGTLNEINSQGIFTIILCVVLVLLLIVEGTKLWKGTLESLDLKSGKELRENAVNERLNTLESELENVKTTFLDNQETYHGILRHGHPCGPPCGRYRESLERNGRI